MNSVERFLDLEAEVDRDEEMSEGAEEELSA